MPETLRRRERGQRNGSEAFGHGRPSDRSPLPRRLSFPDAAQREPLPESAANLPDLEPAFWETLEDGLRAMGLEFSEADRGAIDAHIRLLLAWNSAINLTALRTPEQVARNHVLDSLIAAPTLAALAGQHPTLIDIGSGGGFPGVPLAIHLRARRLALVESIGKKARFLEVVAREVTKALGAPTEAPTEIEVLPERAEDLADEPDHREGWDLVTARAVGGIAEVAELGLPLARRGGHVAAWKLDTADGSLQREIREALRICQAAGGGPPRVVALPFAAIAGLPGHCLVVIRKHRPTPDRYPRQPGKRRRSPLLS